MGLIPKVDAAIKLGITMELLDYFTKRCPKPGFTFVLQTHSLTNGEAFIDENELIAFQRFLNEPWPKPPSGNRPSIPDAIKKDIRAESWHSCAICGDMNNGEIAHIEPVSTTMNNGPDNLIFLCPNHHTQYDYGHKISSNLTIEDVRAAKLMKRKSRQRIMRNEQNATKAMSQLVKWIAELQKRLESPTSETVTIALLTEAQNLMKLIPDAVERAEEAARKDIPLEKIDQAIVKNAPTLNKLVSGIAAQTDKGRISQMVASVAGKVNEILIDIDEVECPHCSGRGQIGLIGDLCSYCGGSCYVSKEESDKYTPEELEETNCPHCNGKGITGLTWDLCGFCGGSCIISTEIAEDYDLDEIDEVACPRCNGNGTYGYHGDFCLLCGGSQVITHQKAEEYDEGNFGQVNCPHCNGKGTLGWNNVFCDFCRGACLIPIEQAESYDPEEVDQVNCPHCDGQGTIGLIGTVCPYCHGDCVMSRETRERYIPSELNEVECPRCAGKGTTGYVGDICKLCKGDRVVSPEVGDAYIEKYGR